MDRAQAVNGLVTGVVLPSIYTQLAVALSRSHCPLSKRHRSEQTMPHYSTHHVVLSARNKKPGSEVHSLVTAHGKCATYPF